MGLSPHTVGKFLCHLAEDPKQTAFMRVYQQIPITGTEGADHDTLARQAIPPPVCGELECFKRLQSGGCSAVPRVLGHAERIQGEHELLSGGYVRYLVWEKVPETSVLSSVLPMSESMPILEPGQSRLSKIIFDQSTGNLHLSGFRRGWPVFSDFEWPDACYVEFELAEPGEETDWYLYPENWKW